MNAFEKSTLLTEDEKHEFVSGLEHMLKNGPIDCKHTNEYSVRILEEMGFQDVGAIINFFESRGGYCDCEVMLNVVCGDDE